MTNAELNAMPWTASLMTTDELFEWLANRKEAARAIDIESASSASGSPALPTHMACSICRRKISAPMVRPHAGKSRLDRGGGSAGRQIRGDDGQGRAARAGDRSRGMNRYPVFRSPTWRRIARLDAAAEASARLSC